MRIPLSTSILCAMFERMCISPAVAGFRKIIVRIIRKLIIRKIIVRIIRKTIVRIIRKLIIRIIRTFLKYHVST